MSVGNDIPFSKRLDIYLRAKRNESIYQIMREVGVHHATAKLWSSPEKIAEIESTQSFATHRAGHVGRKLKYHGKEKEKLMDRLECKGMTQLKLAKEENSCPKTIRKATRYDYHSNPDGCYPYEPRSAPSLTPRIQEQSMEYVKKSPIGKAAHASDWVWDREKKKWAFVDHCPVSFTGSINRKHVPNWKRKSTKRKHGLETSQKQKKHGLKLQCFTCISWKKKEMFIHADRYRKSAHNAKPTYGLRKIPIEIETVVEVIRDLFGPSLKRAGIKFVFADNDSKLQSEEARREWAKFGIKLWPGAGQVTHTAKGGFPVNRPACMPLDQSVHAAWKTHRGGLYDTWNQRAARRKTPGGFLNVLEESWIDLPMKKVRAAIDQQRKILKEIKIQKGGRTRFDTD